MSDPSVQLRIMRDIAAERQRQDAKWGEQNHSDAVWSAILGEKYGEVCKALLDEPEENLIKELTQVAAVAVSWLEAIERRNVKRNNAVIEG